MANRYEQFVIDYLRLNGYFTVPNFIVHDSRRVWDSKVGNRTESDVLAVRMPYSNEHTEDLQIANDPLLVHGHEGKFDVVIGEAKSGTANNPNKVWRKEDNSSQEDIWEKLQSIEYLIRFVGLFSDGANCHTL